RTGLAEARHLQFEQQRQQRGKVLTEHASKVPQPLKAQAKPRQQAHALEAAPTGAEHAVVGSLAHVAGPMRPQGPHIPAPAPPVGPKDVPPPGPAFGQQSASPLGSGPIEKLRKCNTAGRSDPAGADQAWWETISHAPPPVEQASNVLLFSGRL